MIPYMINAIFSFRYNINLIHFFIWEECVKGGKGRNMQLFIKIQYKVMHSVS